MRRSGTKLIIVALLLLIALAVRPIILGAKLVKLPSAPPLTGQVSQAFTSGDTATLPRQGKDYQLQNTLYFDNRQWVVTTAKALNTTTNDSMLILHRQDGIYKVVMGPGSAFPSTQISVLPADVANYLTNLGAVYESL